MSLRVPPPRPRLSTAAALCRRLGVRVSDQEPRKGQSHTGRDRILVPEQNCVSSMFSPNSTAESSVKVQATLPAIMMDPDSCFNGLRACVAPDLPIQLTSVVTGV